MNTGRLKMPRPKSRDGRRVPVSFKISEPEADLLDSVRGGTERSVWLRDAALSVLQGTAPAPVKRVREKALKAAARPADPVEAPSARPAPVTPAEPPQAVFSGPVAKTAAVTAPSLRRASDLQAPPRCPHAGVRVTGGWCVKCQADVAAGGKLPEGWVKPEGWQG